MINNILSNKFIRNIITVASGTAGAQLITICLLPIITRLYTPSDFGVLNTYTAILGILLPITALTYPMAIILPRNKKSAINIIQISLILSMSTSLIALIIIVLFKNKIAISTNLIGYELFLILIPLAMLINGFQQTCEQWLFRIAEFKISSKITVLHSLILNSTKVFGGFVKPTAATLIITQSLSSFYYIICYILFTRRNINLKHKLNTKKAIIYFRKHSDFYKYRTPQVLLNAISQSIPVILIASLFNIESAGLYALCKSVLSAPILLIGSSVGNVFYPKFNNLYIEKIETSSLFKKTTLSLFIVATLIFIPVFLSGPFLFELAFGQNWTEAGNHAKWIAIWLIFSIAARPAIAALPVINGQKFFLIHELAFLAPKISCFYIGEYLNYNVNTTIAAYSIVTGISYVVLIIYFYFKIKKS